MCTDILFKVTITTRLKFKQVDQVKTIKWIFVILKHILIGCDICYSWLCIRNIRIPGYFVFREPLLSASARKDGQILWFYFRWLAVEGSSSGFPGKKNYERLFLIGIRCICVIWYTYNGFVVEKTYITHYFTLQKRFLCKLTLRQIFVDDIR